LTSGISAWRIAWVTPVFLLLHLVSSLGQFLLALNSWPINTITYWLTTPAKDWEGIEPWIGSEDLFPVFSSAYIVYALEWFSKLIKVLNSGLVFTCQHNMKLQKCSHQAYYDEIQNIGDHYHHHLS
jgi:hypothetical protein